ncbi:NAD-dependent epimerase/dehydratase family protein [Eubacterium callanderi]|uniref:NAD-dependent epimerase/dehydratase family protein n=1 Tax=Eubacterium callanderi TaxID=53442 RepID=UPI001AA1B050|nr:NAD-dependent epimerase/dehydratase family protein [Eubacterium callanderi]MBO1704265.1 NAD-dependent epimerase/dehydratase family protein [Eubacterium callanderi]
MKRILITGKDSYIGTSFEKWVSRWPEEYHADTLDTKGYWQSYDFSPYDVVFHVAGIAHVDAKDDMEDLYYQVNRDLTIEAAQKAKAEGVEQFIFMSSIIVYGDSSKLGEKRVITKDTIPTPTNFYGNSKLQAEQGILPLQDEHFKVVILRPPMIYGKGSKGNYPKLARLAQKTPIFPDIENERSMLYIENLCEFIRLMIDNEARGVFFPQNKEYVKTTELVKTIAEVYGKKMRLTKVFNGLIRCCSKKVSAVNKVFGSLVYEKEMSVYQDFEYCRSNFKQTIEKTEG